MVSKHNIRLNPNRSKTVHTGITLASGDKGITLAIEVEEMDCSNTTAKIVFKRNNGTSVEADITGSDNVYTYELQGNELEVPGLVVADVKFYEGTKRISTATFTFTVSGDTMDGLGAGTGGYSDRLEQLVAEAEEAGELTEQARAELESVKSDLLEMEAEMEEVLQDFKTQYGEEGALNPRGAWNSTASYQIRDVVYYGGFSWTCLVANKGVTPSETNSTTWGKHMDLEGIEGKIDSIQTTSTVSLSQVGWYRVAEYVSPSIYNVLGDRGNIADLFIKRSFSNNDNEYHQLRLRSVYNSQEIVSLDSKSKAQLITKARMTYETGETNKAYLEIYYNSNSSNITTFVVSNGNDHGVCWQAITPTLTSETVSGVTVTTTYDIPANASPVTDLDLFSNIGDYANLDFDTATKMKIYESTGTPSSVGATNYPQDSTGLLIVFGNGSIIHQMYITHDGNVFERTKLNWVGYPWSKWEQTATTADLTTALAGYLKNTGGRIDGIGAHPFAIRGSMTSIYLDFENYTDELVGAIGFSDVDKPVFIPKSYDKVYPLLHSGNYGDYTVYKGTSAPSSTAPLWIDTANKKLKAYIDGAWTVIA